MSNAEPKMLRTRSRAKDASIVEYGVGGRHVAESERLKERTGSDNQIGLGERPERPAEQDGPLVGVDLAAM